MKYRKEYCSCVFVLNSILSVFRQTLYNEILSGPNVTVHRNEGS